MSEEAVTLESTMDATMGAVFDKMHETPAVETMTESAPVSTDASPSAARDRAPDGKFTTKAAPAAAAATKITDQAQTKVVETQAPAASIDAPQSWSAEAKALWASISPEAQKIIAQREGEAHKQITQTGERLKGYETFEQMLHPYRAELVSTWGSEARGVEALLNLARTANADWHGFIREQSRLRGFDLSQLAPAPGTQPADPHIAALTQELTGLKSTLAQREKAEYESRRDAIQSEIDAFKADKPHWQTLEPRMIELCEKGIAKTYRDAYDMACKLDPTISATIATEKAMVDKAKADEEAKKLAAEAQRHVAANATSKGNGASPAKPRSWEDTMSAAYDRAVA